MKKSIYLVSIITLLIVGLFVIVTNFSKDKIIVHFSGIEGLPIKTEIKNQNMYECSVQTTNMTRNGDELDLKCRNRFFSFISKRKIVTVSDLFQIGILDFNKFEIQLIKDNIDFANPDYVYVKVNKDADNVVDIGISYYIFYKNGLTSKYYIFNNLLIKDGVYTQVSFNTDGSFTINAKINSDVVNNVNFNDFGKMFQVIENIGYQKVKN